MSRPNIIPLYTYDDYKLWKGDWELIAGHPVAMSPFPKRKHQLVAKKIVLALEYALQSKQDCNCEVIYEIDWIIEDLNVVRPDLLISCDDNSEDDFIKETPSLIVEVLSSSTKEKDINTKFNLYESNGVNYYFIVDPDEENIEVYQLIEGKYQLLNSDEVSYEIILNDECKLLVDLSQVFKP